MRSTLGRFEVRISSSVSQTALRFTAIALFLSRQNFDKTTIKRSYSIFTQD